MPVIALLLAGMLLGHWLTRFCTETVMVRYDGVMRRRPFSRRAPTWQLQPLDVKPGAIPLEEPVYRIHAVDYGLSAALMRGAGMARRSPPAAPDPTNLERAQVGQGGAKDGSPA